LRPVEVIQVTDAERGRLLVLRDTQGIASGHVALPAALGAVLARFDGRRTCREIAADVGRQLDEEVPTDLVVHLAIELDRALLLHGPRFEEAKREVEQAFVRSAVRPASHAGGAYHADPGQLARYLDDDCLGRADGASEASANGKDGPSGAAGKRLIGLIAPHIDPWRGAVGYGAAYRHLRARLAPEADTFVVFGTSHAPMRRPFALCRKDFATPLGAMPADLPAIDELAEACDFDPYEDVLNHKREHSIEFQAVFLRHLLGGRRATIVPVLAGLGEAQAAGREPSGDRRIERFFDGVRALVAARPGRVVVVAGADLAHVGPRFGDAQAHDPSARRQLEARDRASLERARAADASAFFAHVAEDLETRRVCGLGPIYALLRSLEGGTSASDLLHYEQTVDEGDGSIVSHAALAFHG
jgi:AmmeMemoRadiSam system protein B